MMLYNKRAFVLHGKFISFTISYRPHISMRGLWDMEFIDNQVKGSNHRPRRAMAEAQAGSFRH